MTLKTHDLNYFHGKNIFGDDSFRNMSLYQPTLDTLKLKKDKGSDYVVGWKSVEVYTSKLKPLHPEFLHSTKLSGYRIRIKIDKDPQLRTKQLREQSCKYLRCL